jgi:hypothetical protein
MVVIRKHGIDALGFFARVAEQQHGMNGRAFVVMIALISLGAILYASQMLPLKVAG